MPFSRKTNKNNYDYKLERLKIQRVFFLRDLGVIFHFKLLFDSQISDVTSKSFKRLSVILKIAKNLNLNY